MIQVDVDEPLIQPFQGVLLEVPVGLVVPTADDKGLSYYPPLWQGPKILVVPVGIFSYFLYLLVPGPELLLGPLPQLLGVQGPEGGLPLRADMPPGQNPVLHRLERAPGRVLVGAPLGPPHLDQLLLEVPGQGVEHQVDLCLRDSLIRCRPKMEGAMLAVSTS